MRPILYSAKGFNKPYSSCFIFLQSYKHLACICCLSVLLLSCGSGGGSSDVPNTDVTHTSDLGIRVHIPESIYTTCLWLKSDVVCDPDEIDVILLSWVDVRVEEWIASHPKQDPDAMLGFVRALKITLVDGWFTFCEAGPGDLCGGLTKDGRIVAAIYDLFFSLDNCPGSPRRLVFSTEKLSFITGRDYWLGIPQKFGCGIREDLGLPSLVHELDNIL